MANISVQIRTDTREVERMLRNFKNGADRVLSRTLNKTIRPVNKVAIRSIAAELRVPQKRVRPAVLLRRATFRNQRAIIDFTGKRLPVIALGARQTKKGVTHRETGGGRKLLPGAFIARMPSGHRGVFRRRGKERLHIDELFSLPISIIVLQKHIQSAMDAEAQKAWDKNLDHELRFWLKQNG